MTLERNVETWAVAEFRLVGADPIKLGFDGLPDQLIRWGKNLHFWCEFKALKGRYRAAQVVWRKHLLETGDTHYTPQTRENVRDIIEFWMMVYGPATARVERENASGS